MLVTETLGATTRIEGEIPLAEAFGYSTTLRSMTQGQGTFSMEFAKYKKSAELDTRSDCQGTEGKAELKKSRGRSVAQSPDLWYNEHNESGDYGVPSSPAL